ncbi:MAG TPA: hypothetical protein PK325_10665 [Cyclobacteriaceae bacterium]|nr:hypothetical protein [Cyclobacteriaceae bacterium]HMV09231.1 hypothetical protein [Cyclobacteriaceae bacterium]HMV90956.1 hypothetical protein [Cyclobacteriaceae bacterium]HMX01400.1 hypothetical protein [Cyclobacteriaceae bacterium]HMX50330.1 hypothetical protein [Cyclobacteriaceae bacterium]
MRQFSDYEKKIISTHLINGAGITGMLSSDLLEKGKFHITIDPDKRQRFEFYSSEIPVEAARDEMVNLIELLIYLDEEKLLRMYPPVSTNLDDFNATVSFTFGDTWSEQKLTFLLHEKSNYLGEFLKWRRDYFFKVTEPLKNLAENNFQTAEEIRHNQILNQANRANRLTLVVAVATILIGFAGIAIQSYMQEKQLLVDQRLFETESKGTVKDSIIFILLQTDLHNLQNDLASIHIMSKKLQVRLDSLAKAQKMPLKTNNVVKLGSKAP